MAATLPYFTLVADDSPNDLQLLILTLKRHPAFRVVHQSLGGVDTIAYLKGEPPFADRQRHPYPDVLICDLKMPVTDGFKVLACIKEYRLPPLVTIVLTGSEDPADADRAKELGADAVCIKPVTLEHLRDAANRLESFMATHPKCIHCGIVS